MKRQLLVFMSLQSLGCVSAGPELPPAPSRANSSGADVRSSPVRCTEQEWTPELVRGRALEAYETSGLEIVGAVGVRGTLPILPSAMPSSSCSVVLYFYYALEPIPGPLGVDERDTLGLSSPLVAVATVDLRSSNVDVERIDFGDALESPVMSCPRWHVDATYRAVREAEDKLLHAVISKQTVSGPAIFKSYGNAWQKFPHFLDLLPPVHRDFIDEMLRVRPVQRPKYPGGWTPLERPEGDGSAP